MGIPGAKPKPNAMKKLSGSRRANEQEPQLPDALDLRPPRGRLSKDARAFWKDYAQILADARILKASDLPAFEMMCIHYGIATQAQRQVQAEGMTVVDKNGSVRKHPLLQVLKDNSLAFSRYATLFGLNPVDRGRLKVDDDDPELLQAFLMAAISEGR